MYSPTLVTWRSQYDRMERGYTRLIGPYQSSTNCEDDIQHYFQDCWHLKGWIINDTHLSLNAVSVESEINNHRALRIVADLANACKHLKRHTHREGAHVTSSNVTVHLGQNKPTDIDYIVTLDDGSSLSEKDLVKEIFDAWQKVLQKFNLL